VLDDLVESEFKTVCEARREFGINKYSQPLQFNDGRDSIIDLFQELLDAVVYAKKALKEGKLSKELYLSILNTAINVYIYYHKEKVNEG
jgi:hypothetical protein